MDYAAANQIIRNAKNDSKYTDLNALFANVHGMTFASICYVSDIQTAAASPLRGYIVKVSRAQVMLANNLKEYTNVFLNAVKRSADSEIKEWIPSESYYEHTTTFCVVQHKTKPERFYLYVIYQNHHTTDTCYINTLNGEVMFKEEVAAELAPAAAQKLLNGTADVYNKTNDIYHNVHVRTISLDNLASITLQGSTHVGPFNYLGF